MPLAMEESLVLVITMVHPRSELTFVVMPSCQISKVCGSGAL